MWYFIAFTYSTGKKKAVGFVAAYGEGNKIYRTEIACNHMPPQYLKLIFGGKQFEYPGFNGQFANIFYDIDAPAFIDTEEDLKNAIKKLSNPPQYVASLIDLQVIEQAKTFSANEKGDSLVLDPQEG